MNILVLDDEIYLAQKVVVRLQEEGHNCDNFSSVSDIPSNNKKYDTVLLSTNISIDDCEMILKKYKNSIIILLVSYVSDATVTKPINLGAADYVLKPFIIDELIRKINYFNENKLMLKKMNLYDKYFKFIFSDIYTNIDLDIKLPLLVETNDQKFTDKIAFDLAIKRKKDIEFISLSNNTEWEKDFISKYKNKIIYLTNYNLLKNSVKELLHENIKGKDVLICSFEEEKDFQYKKVILNNRDKSMVKDNIMPINEYVKLMVNTFQSKYPDTELSKKLGISRKSLWEKRKKFNLQKRKS